MKAAKEYAEADPALAAIAEKRWPHFRDAFDDDRLAEPLSYGNGPLSFKKFCELMDEFEEKQEVG